MTFSEALEELMTILKKPEKRNQAKRELNAAMSFYSLDSNFKRDYAEVSPALDVSLLTQSVALTNFPNFRKFHYIKRGGTKNFLKILPDSELFNPNCDMRNRYYVVGNNLNINMDNTAATIDVGYFKFPPILTGAINEDPYWMLDVSPFMIIDRAASAVFRAAGDDQDFKSYAMSARDSYLAFRKDQEVSTQ